MIELKFPTDGFEQPTADELQVQRARVEKLEQIRASIETGTYYIPSEQIAGKIIRLIPTRRTSVHAGSIR